jgi:hypothetical protein
VGNWQFGLHSTNHVQHRCGGGGHYIKSDIIDDSNINVASRAGAGGDPLDGNGNDDAIEGGRKRGRQGSDLWSFYTDDINPH